MVFAPREKKNKGLGNACLFTKTSNKKYKPVHFNSWICKKPIAAFKYFCIRVVLLRIPGVTKIKLVKGTVPIITNIRDIGKNYQYPRAKHSLLQVKQPTACYVLKTQHYFVINEQEW